MKEILEDYRCECGKLLLRGLILTGEIEVKCRYCKRVEVIRGLTGSLSSDLRYVLFLDEKGIIIRASSSAEKHLGITQSELAGTHISDHMVMLESSFYKTMWEELTEYGTTGLFKTLQRSSDKSLAPITIDARAITATNATYMVFTVEKNNASKEFGAGGVTKE
jgi:PAS domain S-box-containing protein